MALAVLLLVCAPYAATAVAYAEARRRGEAPPRWARVVGGLTVVAHLSALVAVGRATGRSPFQTESQALSFLAFSVAGIYVVLEATSRVATYGGRFHLLTAVLAGAAVPGLAREDVLAALPRAHDVSFSLHVGFALLGTAALAASGLLAAGYLGAYRRMKRRDLDPEASAGPSLSGLQRLARDASFAGALLLAPSLVLGWRVLSRSATPGPWGGIEIGLSVVEVALTTAAAFLWWQRPRQGPVAAWCNLVATTLAVVSFAVVHPHVTGA